jgi:prepilin-type N-terminal cleavage/methylation domain-containing protein
MRSVRRGRRGGFTLVEVVIALAVGGMVVLAAHQLFAVVADTADRVPVAARATNRARNQERFLRELLARAEVGSDSAERFNAQPNLIRFISWCPTPGGWLERCAVELALSNANDSVALDARWMGRRSRLVTRPGRARFLYLRSASGGGEWLSRWGDAISAPLAVRIAFGDTAVFLRVGPRG